MADLISTVLGIKFGVATEENPLMAALIEKDLALFVIIKSLTTFSVCGVLYWNRELKLAQHAANIIFWVYLIILIYHSILWLTILL